MIRRGLSILSILALAACAEEILPLTPPGLEGPLTEGRWEQRVRTSITFWPPSAGNTRLPEMIDFSCVEGAKGQLRIVLTGDTDRTGLWIAGDNPSAKTAIIETALGATKVDFTAGKLLLPSAVIRTDTEWLQPLLSGEGRMAINAYGDRTYRLAITEDLGQTIRRCGRVS